MTGDDIYGPAPRKSATKPGRPGDSIYGTSSVPAQSGGGFVHDALNLGGAALNRIGVPRVIDLLDRQRQTTQAAIAGDHPGRTLLHGAGQDQQDANRASVRHKMGLDDPNSVLGRTGTYAQAPHWLQGLADFAVDTLTDPVTYESLGTGAVAKQGVRGIGALAKAAGKASPELAAYGNAFVRDFMTAGGAAKRELGDATYNKAMAADNRQAAREQEAARRMTERFDKHIAPLAPADKRTVYRVLNGEQQITDPASGRLIVPQHVADAVAEGKRLRTDMAALQADASGRRRLGYNVAPLANSKYASRVEPSNLNFAKPLARDQTRYGPQAAQLRYAMEHPDDVRPKGPAARRIVGRADRAAPLSDDLKDFAAPDEQGILGAQNLRSNYLPGPHQAEAAASNARPQPFNLLRPFAPNALTREEFTVGDKSEDLGALDEAFRGAIRNAAQQGTAGRLRAELGVPLSENAAGRNDWLEKLFDVQPRATGDARTTAEKAADRWRQLINIPKNTVTTLGLKHGLVNVPSLALTSEGLGAAGEALARGARIAFLNPGERYNALREGIEGGVVAPFEDRENPIADALARLPGPLGKLLGGASQKANALTWAIDDAAKQAVMKRKVARGMTPDEAAADTLREMVDYRHRSAFTKKAANVAPFATFRTKIPSAVASAGARHPNRLLAIDRATQGLGSNAKVQIGTNDDGSPRKLTMTTPTSDVLGIGDNPFKYLRSSLADPVKAALSVPGDVGEAMGMSWHDARFLRGFTYGQHLLPNVGKEGHLKAGFLGGQAAGYVPYGLGNLATQASGLSEYQPEDWLSILLGSPLGVHVR